jgi:hypothetical protein
MLLAATTTQVAWAPDGHRTPEALLTDIDSHPFGTGTGQLGEAGGRGRRRLQDEQVGGEPGDLVGHLADEPWRAGVAAGSVLHAAMPPQLAGRGSTSTPTSWAGRGPTNSPVTSGRSTP